MGKQARREAQAATQGDALRQLILGLQYERGEGVPQDKAQAAQLYRQAADQGLADVQYRLGLCYMNGAGVPEDMAQAARLYQQAADQGLDGAWFGLDILYEKGDGVPQDIAQAARLYRQAADQGLTDDAQCNLGLCYEHGKGVRYDIGEAVALYRLAIAGECVRTNLSLGLCFEKGRGVPIDRAEAERLYQLAVRSGSADDAHALTSESMSTLDGAIAGPLRRMALVVALQLTRDAVFNLNLAARLGDTTTAEHLATLAGRRDVTSACCVGCGASRKLKTCSKCGVARFCVMECTTRVWPAHKASCKAWRKDAGGQAED
jgi:TPR repeat protein